MIGAPARLLSTVTAVTVAFRAMLVDCFGPGAFFGRVLACCFLDLLDWVGDAKAAGFVPPKTAISRAMVP
jgi:hypothetical protein